MNIALILTLVFYLAAIVVFVGGFGYLIARDVIEWWRERSSRWVKVHDGYDPYGKWRKC